MQDTLRSRRSFPWPIPILPAADGDQAGPHGQTQDSRRRFGSKKFRSPETGIDLPQNANLREVR